MAEKRFYCIEDKSGRVVKNGCFSQPEVRMAAKAGFRVFEYDKACDSRSEVTTTLNTLFDGGKRDSFF